MRITWDVITCAYQPEHAGLGGYAHNLASALATAGDTVRVWCPGQGHAYVEPTGVQVRPALGRFGRADLTRVASELDALPGPRRLLLHWVPQGYGAGGLNLFFCRWMQARAARGAHLDLVVHQPFLPLGNGSWPRRAMGVINRQMMRMLLRAADRVWLSTEAWMAGLAPLLGREADPRQVLRRMPVSAMANVAPAFEGVQWRGSMTGAVVGHYVNRATETQSLLLPILRGVLARRCGVTVRLIGAGSEAALEALRLSDPAVAAVCSATGACDDAAVAEALLACDVAIQPFADGVTTRRSSALTSLAYGVPVVSTDGWLTEPLWRERRAVRLVPSHDPDRAADAVDALLGDRGAREQLGAAGQRFFRDICHPTYAVDALHSRRGSD